MGLDNPTHILLLFVLVLLVFGARRLPEIGRSLGSGLREFKHSISGESPAQAPQPQQTLPPAAASTQSQQAVAQAPGTTPRAPDVAPTPDVTPTPGAAQAQDAFAQREPVASDRG